MSSAPHPTPTPTPTPTLAPNRVSGRCGDGLLQAYAYGGVPYVGEEGAGDGVHGSGEGARVYVAFLHEDDGKRARRLRCERFFFLTMCVLFLIATSAAVSYSPPFIVYIYGLWSSVLMVCGTVCTALCVIPSLFLLLLLLKLGEVGGLLYLARVLCV